MEEAKDGKGGAGGAIGRIAARVLMLDETGRVLLFRGRDSARPEAGNWWFTPGGALESGETPEAAARREVYEETGYRLTGDLGPVVFEQTIWYSFEQVEYEQHEQFFRVQVEHGRLDYSGWTETERRTVQTHRWWTAAELATTTEVIYPATLLDLIPDR